MTARSNGSVTGQLQYDPENRLIRVTGNGAEVTLLYDADGRLMKRTEGTGATAAVTIYLGENHEKKITGTQTKTVKYYAFAGKPIAMRQVYSGQANYYYLLTDHLGSTSVTYNAVTGSVSSKRYLPWGDMGSSGLPTDRTFTGQRFDSSLGLYDYGARYYDATIGHFIQADTLVPDVTKPQDWNRYSYARNNPLRHTDPSGHYPVDPSSYIYRGEDFRPPIGPIGVPPRWPAAPVVSLKPNPSFLFVEGTGGSISAPMGDVPGVAHYKTFQARNLQQFKPLPVDLLTNVYPHPGLGLTAVWDTAAILQKYDLRGSQLYAHSAGTWSAIPAGIVGGARSVDVYGTPLVLPLNGSVKVPLTNTTINFHTRHNDPAGYAAPFFTPILAPFRAFSLFGMVSAALDSYRDYHDFAAGHDYLKNPAPIR